MRDRNADALVNLWAAVAAGDLFGGGSSGLRIRDVLIAALQPQTDRAAECEIASFLHLDGHVAIAHGGAGR